MSRTMRAYVSVGAVKDSHALTNYLVLGRGEMRQQHERAGTNRAAAMYCDDGTPWDFMREAARTARLHSRKNEAYSLIVSHPQGRYDADDSDSIRAMLDNDVEGARRAYPGSKLLAVAHVDGEGSHGCGGKPHTHIVTMNHDVTTGKAITANRTAPAVRAIYNELGAELGWSEAEVTHTLDAPSPHTPLKLPDAPDTSKDDASLAAERERLARVGAFELSLFDDAMAARDAAKGKSYAEWSASFEAELTSRGITMKRVSGKRGPHQKRASKGTQGITYARRNEATNRVRTMKASDLGPPLKLAGLQAAHLDYLRSLDAARQAQIARDEAQPARTSSLDAITVDHTLVGMDEAAADLDRIVAAGRRAQTTSQLPETRPHAEVTSPMVETPAPAPVAPSPAAEPPSQPVVVAPEMASLDEVTAWHRGKLAERDRLKVETVQALDAVGTIHSPDYAQTKRAHGVLNARLDAARKVLRDYDEATTFVGADGKRRRDAQRARAYVYAQLHPTSSEVVSGPLAPFGSQPQMQHEAGRTFGG